MKTRVDLNEILSSFPGVEAVYFSPPEGMLMKYPCIVYQLINEDITFADNRPYKKSKRYQVTVIDEDPDSEIPEHVSDLMYCTSDRNFVSDGLHHFSYTLYF